MERNDTDDLLKWLDSHSKTTAESDREELDEPEEAIPDEEVTTPDDLGSLIVDLPGFSSVMETGPSNKHLSAQAHLERRIAAFLMRYPGLSREEAQELLLSGSNSRWSEADDLIICTSIKNSCDVPLVEWKGSGVPIRGNTRVKVTVCILADWFKRSEEAIWARMKLIHQDTNKSKARQIQAAAVKAGLVKSPEEFKTIWENHRKRSRKAKEAKEEVT